MRWASAVLMGLALAACTDPAAPLVPAELTVVRGPGDLAVPGASFDTIAIRLTAANGAPVAGWEVDWSGDGDIERYDLVTDAMGIVRVRWTLPRYLPDVDYLTNGPSGSFGLTAAPVGLPSRRLTTTARAFTADQVVELYGEGCGLRDHQLWCWDSALDPAGFPMRLELPAGVTPSLVEGSQAMLCVLGQSGDPWCRSSHPVGNWAPVPGSPPLIDLFPDGDWDYQRGVCGRAASDSTTWCWKNAGGVTTAERVIAMPMTQVAFGSRFGCGLDAEGAAWCWGDNVHGQLGTLEVPSSDVPRRVELDQRFTKISTGYQTACALAIDQRVWCWGDLWAFSSSSAPSVVDPATVPAAHIVVGSIGELYVLRGNQLRVKLTPFDEVVDARFFSHILVRSLSAGHGSVCLVSTSREVYCSQQMLGRVITESIIPDDPIPVPDPASGPS